MLNDKPLGKSTTFGISQFRDHNASLGSAQVAPKFPL